MSNVIGNTAPVQAINTLASTSKSSTAPTENSMGSDTFLKLLVAQLKYQDPTKPADGTALMGQTAQFQMVEQLQQLAAQTTQLLSEQQASSAIALVGRTISYTQGEQTLSGVVGSVRLTAAGPMLAVGQTDVPLSSVTEISAAG
jgi:flagellar basal-body rod modification protein FlgD